MGWVTVSAKRSVSSRARRPRVGVRRDALKARSREHDPVSPRVQVSEMQRARLLSAAVVTVDELGYARASVANITSRARVSRRTFYDLFSDREDCLLAVMDDAVELIASKLAAAEVAFLPWRERVRMGLWTILCFCDREPELARVCVVQGARGGQRVLERRDELFRRLAVVLDEGRAEGARAGEVPSLTAEGLVGAAVAIVHKRLLAHEREPLSGLLGELMSMIVLPYLGPAVARRERALPAPGPVAVVSSRTRGGVRVSREDSLEGISMRLTYRTARVLEVIAQRPGVSNRVVAERAGVSDQGQVSKLLARLQRLGLLANTGEGHSKGEPNAWRLTALGERVTGQLALSVDSH